MADISHSLQNVWASSRCSQPQAALKYGRVISLDVNKALAVTSFTLRQEQVFPCEVLFDI